MTNDSRPAVRVRGVVRRFGDVRALDGVSLEVPPGVVYGLLGPNGAGKTTLIRVLTTLLRPDEGTVEVAGVDVLRDPGAARARIGLAGQFAAVDEYLTGRENVEMIGRLYGLSAKEARGRAADVLERIGLAGDAHRRVSTYSGGMRRRLDLAASLVGRPQVMFLDEPTTGVDPRSRMELWELVEDLVASGTTVLLTTQYLEEVDRLAARIAVIHKGRIVTEGTGHDLKATLGGSVIELVVNERMRSRTMRILEQVTGDVPVHDPVEDRLRVAAPKGATTLVQVVRALDAARIKPVDLALHKPTLDDVFMALTGDAPVGETAPAAGMRA